VLVMMLYFVLILFIVSCFSSCPDDPFESPNISHLFLLVLLFVTCVSLGLIL
jgi:hypothetical protein